MDNNNNLRSKISSFFLSFKVKLLLLRAKVAPFFSFFNKKNTIISLFTGLFAIAVLVIGVYYVKFRQNMFPTRASGVQLQLVSTSTTVKKGEEFSVDVYIDTKEATVSGTDLEIKYDQDVLSAESIQNGSFLPVVFVPGQIASASGLARIVLGCDPANPKKGSGVLASVKFNVLGQGTNTTISFDPATSVAALGQTTSVLGAQTPLDITILGTASSAPIPAPTTPKPTNTSAPTATPAATPTITPAQTITPTHLATPTPAPTTSPEPSVIPL